MALAVEEGLALVAGLNVSPNKSYLSEYSSRVSHTQTTQLLAAWHDQVNPLGLFDGASFNLDFHSVPYYGEDPVVERHFVSARSRRQPSILAFLAQDAAGRAFCYSTFRNCGGTTQGRPAALAVAVLAPAQLPAQPCRAPA